jgi:ankyrin repeat protein
MIRTALLRESVMTRVMCVLAAGLLTWPLAGLAAGVDPSLVEAVKRGQRDVAIALLSRGADVNIREEDGTSALHWAVRANDAELVASLLRAGASANATNRYGIMPIWLAATNGSASIVTMLLDAGADPRSALPEGETVLMTAARTGRLDAITALIARGADIDAREHMYGQTALMWAAAENHADAARALIEAGAKLDLQSEVFDPPARWSLSSPVKGGFTPLMFAARQGALDAARVLVAAGADLNLAEPDGITPLLLAIINGHYDLAAFLVESGADVNRADQAGVSALYQAVDMHTLEFAANRPPPRWPNRIDSVGLVKVLLEHGAQPDIALRRGRPARKGDQIFGDPFLVEGATPFFLAAKRGDVPVMRLLLEHGADPHRAPARQRASALMVAAGVGWRELSSNTPERHALEAVKLLWDLGGYDINAASVAGQTALHGAAARGATSIIQFLVDRGARLDLKDIAGRTPLDETAGVLDGAGHPPRPEAEALLRRLIGIDRTASSDAIAPR